MDWTHNFVPNVAQAYSAKDPAHYHAFYATTAYPHLARLRRRRSTRTASSPFRKALSLAINRNDVSKLGEYGYAPPTDALGINGIFPAWVKGASVKATAQAAGDLQPDGGEEAAHRRRLHLQGHDAARPEGQPGQARHPRDLGLVGLGRVEPDHHEEPPGDRHRLERRARARLELVVPERVRDEEPDPALADRLAGLAVRLLPTRTSPNERSRRPARTRRTPATGRTTRTRRRRPSSTSGRRPSTPKKQQKLFAQLAKHLPRRISRSSRCSSGRAGRPTARSTSIASRRRRTSTATRSSPRLPTTSSRSRGSAPAARPARDDEVAGPSDGRRRAGHRVPPTAAIGQRRPDMRWFLRRLGFYVFATWVALTITFLLPRVMPGDPIGGILQHLSPAQIQSNPGIIKTYQALLGGGDQSIWSAYGAVPAPGRDAELRHLDLELPDEGVRGRRPDAAVLDRARRHRVRCSRSCSARRSG